MSLATRNKTCSYCYFMNSSSEVFDMHYFIGNICIAIMAVVLAINKYDPLCSFFDMLSQNFIGNQDIYIPKMAKPLASK